MINRLTAMDRELFILGIPVETILGKVRFLTYMEYLTHMPEIAIVKMNVLHIYHEYRTKDNPLEHLKTESLFNIVTGENVFVDAYVKLFSLVLDMQETDEAIVGILENIFDSEEMFMSFRSLVMEMNMISESQVSGNPTIQAFIEKDRMHKSKGADKTTVSDITSSLSVGAGIDYDKLANMTVLQVYADYYRIAAIFAYQTTTLFATVGGSAIESWSKHIDLFEKEQVGMSMDKFNKNYGDLF